MNFIKQRAFLNERLDDLIASKETVFNESLQDMLKAALANFTGKDNSDAPTLPKTPSTSRRLRSRQQKKSRQHIDTQNGGSPQLSKMRPLGNLVENTDQTIATVRRSSRKAVVKAKQAISEQTGKKKVSSDYQSENEIAETSDSDNESKDSIQHDQTFTSCDKKLLPPDDDQSLTPLVTETSTLSLANQMVSESGCLNETKILSAPCENLTCSDEDKYSTPPSNVKPKPADDICQAATIIKKYSHLELEAKTYQEIIHNQPCVSLALLTKLTPPAEKSGDVAPTPATVIKDGFNDNHPNFSSSTVIKNHTSSSRVVETPATITKVVSDTKDEHEEQNDRSPELAAIRKPQDYQNGATISSVSESTTTTASITTATTTTTTTTKKKVTPKNPFSPAKLKSTVPLEPSGLLYSSHAPSKTFGGGIKKLAHKEQQMLKAKERLAEKNRRDKERLEQLEKKKEQERLEKKRRNQEQLRKVQERQALLLKKKEVPKIQMQQKLLEVPEEVKTKVTEKLHLEMAEVKKLKETDLTPERESNEERYWEEEKRKRDNFTSSEDYNFYVEKEMEEAKRAKTRMCSVDKIPTTTSTSINNVTTLYTTHDSCTDGDQDYGLNDLQSDDSTDEEDNPRKTIPPWAQNDNLIPSLQQQEERPLDASMAVFTREANTVNLGKIFKNKKQRFFKRTSSAQWSSPPTKTNNDWIV